MFRNHLFDPDFGRGTISGMSTTTTVFIEGVYDYANAAMYFKAQKEHL